MQPVSPVVAQVLQNAGPVGAAMPVVAGPVLAKLPVVEVLDLSAFPPVPPNVVDSQLNSAACWQWEKVSGESMATTSVIAGPTIPVAASQVDKVVELVNSQGPGLQADRVYLGPDFANYVVSTGNSPASSTQESLWWISESGARFGVPREEDTVKSVGVEGAHAKSGTVVGVAVTGGGPGAVAC